MACPAATATSGDGGTMQPCSAVLFLAHVTLFVHLFWGHIVGMGRGAWQHWQFWPDWAASRLVLSALLAIFLGGVFRVFLFLYSFFGAVSQFGLFAAQCPHLCVCGFA